MGLLQVLAIGALALEQVRHRVETETVQPDVQPVAHHVQHGVRHRRVGVVEVGLMMEEPVPVVLAPLGIEGPVRGLGVHEDDAGVAVGLVVVGPHVPVVLGVGGILAGLNEPRVLVAGVVHDHVRHHPDAAPVSFLDEHHRVGQIPVLGQDGEEIGDVVTAITQGRLVEGQQPQTIDAQPFQVVELFDEAPQIPGAVPRAVLEAAHHDLVEDGPLEPSIVDGVDAKG